MSKWFEAYLKKFNQDHVTGNPDLMGEALRTLTFTEERGCYSCFDVEVGFKPITDAEEIKRLRLIVVGDDDFYGLDEQPKAYQNEELGVLVAWYWDGDGILYFETADPPMRLRNADCKHECGWKEYEP